MAMEVDAEQSIQNDTGGKRKAEDELLVSGESSKKARVEHKQPPLKRFVLFFLKVVTC